MIAGVKTVRVAVTSPLGNILGHYERDFRHLDYMAIEGMIEKALKKHMNAAMILVGTPSIAENGIVRHCDIAEMEEVPLVQLLEQRFGLPVHMENEIPKEYMPDFCYTDDIDLYYQEGMYQKALDQKGVL